MCFELCIQEGATGGAGIGGKPTLLDAFKTTVSNMKEKVDSPFKKVDSPFKKKSTGTLGMQSKKDSNHLDHRHDPSLPKPSPTLTNNLTRTMSTSGSSDGYQQVSSSFTNIAL